MSELSELSELSEGQNLQLGVISGVIEAVILQPTLYWKNAKAQQMPFTLDPRTIYRGTGVAVLAECSMMGLQFLFTAVTKKHLQKEGGGGGGGGGDFMAAALGGGAAALFASPLELVMIQQQRFGGSLAGTVSSVVRQQGLLGGGMMRGLTAAACRDSIYVAGMLGLTPTLQRHLEQQQVPTAEASLYASLVGGVVAALPSHPFDCAKTCMQGDLQQAKYKSFSKTVAAIWAEGGIRRLFSGCMWRTINITATVYIANECRNRLSPLLLEGSFPF